MDVIKFRIFEKLEDMVEIIFFETGHPGYMYNVHNNDQLQPIN